MATQSSRLRKYRPSHLKWQKSLSFVVSWLRSANLSLRSLVVSPVVFLFVGWLWATRSREGGWSSHILNHVRVGHMTSWLRCPSRLDPRPFRRYAANVVRQVMRHLMRCVAQRSLIRQIRQSIRSYIRRRNMTGQRRRSKLNSLNL